MHVIPAEAPLPHRMILVYTPSGSCKALVCPRILALGMPHRARMRNRMGCQEECARWHRHRAQAFATREEKEGSTWTRREIWFR